MNIRQVPAHSSNYTHRSTKKKGIVFHWVVGEIGAADASFRNPKRNASAHYTVGSSGVIHQHVKDHLVAWHAGPKANPHYIGIEHAGGQMQSNGRRKHPTPQCHEASAQLCAHLARKHGFGQLVFGKNAFRHNQFMATQCSGSLDVHLIINRANILLNKPTVRMDYKVIKKNNNLHVNIISGGFVGKIKVERYSGPNKGTYIENININRPNGGDGSPVVVDMDAIKYKVIFPNNHKIYDNRAPSQAPQLSQIQKDLNAAKTRAKALEAKLKAEAELNAQKLLEQQQITQDVIKEKELELKKKIEDLQKEYALTIQDLHTDIAEKDLEIDKLEKFSEVKITRPQQLAIDIVNEVEEETGIVKTRVKRWHEFVDHNVSSKMLRSILKYDMFVFFGQNAPRIVIGLTALLAIIQTSDMPAWAITIIILAINGIIDLIGIAVKLIATTFGDKDGELDNSDYKILGGYVSSE